LPDQQRRVPFRVPDEALYALARDIYALEPPPNPHLADPRIPAGRAIFLEEIIGRFEAIAAGVAARHRSSVDSPPAIPDLIGIKDRKYLDRTGLVRHRDLADLMRYAALNNELDFYSNFGGFNPAGKDFRDLPEPTVAG
jgi:hypothetical protein